MPLNLKDVPGGKKFTPQDNLTPGTYPGRVVQIIDLGLQPQREYKGQSKPPAQELSVTYELVDEFMKDEDGNVLEDKPRWISETFPLRNLDNDKARSTERYEVFDKDHTKYNGDFTKILGEPCNITIVNNKSGDKVYDNIGAVGAMRLRDAEKCPPLKNAAVLFDTENPDVEVFNKLPKWLREKIQGNLNYKGSKLEALVGNAPKTEEVKKPEEKPVEDNNPY